jgi:uracil-DNA glycosylase family 4
VARETLTDLSDEIVACRRCPRLVEWREDVASHPPARFKGQGYWARPLPGFGDPVARVLVVGLAPAAHGGNRTGRLFTGDRSGDFLFASLHRTGYANQPTSTDGADGLSVSGMYIAAVVRCAPPDNKPLPEERGNCLPYLIRELQLLTELRVIVPLGKFAWDGVLAALETLGAEREHRPSGGRRARSTPRPAFGHLAETSIGRYSLLGSYHPSQQNTFTGRLTPAMLDAVWRRSRDLAGLD